MDNHAYADSTGAARPARPLPSPGRDFHLPDSRATEPPRERPALPGPAKDRETVAAESRMEDEGGPPLPEPGRARTGGSATTVGEAMSRDVRTVLPDTPIKQLAVLMAGEGIGALPVVLPDQRLLGMVTDRDIVIRVCAGDKSVEDLRAGDVMTIDPTGISADKTVSDALAVMARLQVHRLPVVDDDFRLVGIISTADVARLRNSSRELGEALAEISNRESFWSRIWQ